MAKVTIEDVRAARGRFVAGTRRTPLLPSVTLSRRFGAEIRLKAESLQHTGSFKIRGAANRIAALTDDERGRGVIAASAGNHAQGVAVAAAAHGVQATIVMPRTTPIAKVQATRDYGGEVVLHGDSYQDAFEEAERLAQARGLTIIRAFDDPLVVAGQGTVGLEIIEDWPEVNMVLVPAGGGGLAAGVAIAVKAANAGARVYAVQSAAAPGIERSLAAGHSVSVPPGPTIAEGIAVAAPGEVTFPLLQRYLDGVVTVGEDDIAEAMVLLLERSKLVVEGAGAAGVAAIGSGAVDVTGRRVAVVLSGGNVDINMVARVVEHGLTRAGRYLHLTIGLDDKPGQLAALSALIADTGANILSVAHQRFGIDLAVGRVQVSMLLEVRNHEHAGSVRDALIAGGFARGSESGPEFVPASWMARG
jgi:threonine dehydratase